MVRYNTIAIREDRATLGSDPSALMAAYSIGRYPLGAAPHLLLGCGKVGAGVMLVPESAKSMPDDA